MDKFNEKIGIAKNKRIFLVDDDVLDLNIGKRILQDFCTIVPVPSGIKLLEMLNKFQADLILLDVEMPGMDGYEVIQRLKRNPVTADIPVVFLTAQNDTDDKLKGFSLGAADYINKPFSKPLLVKRIEQLLLLEEQKKELQNFTENLKKITTERREAIDEMQKAILLWTAELIEFRGITTGDDVGQVQLYLKELLTEMAKTELYADEISKWDISFDTILHSAALHDIGKIGVSDNILQKLKALEHNEYEQIKAHSTYGKTLIENLKNRLHNQNFLDHAQTMAFLHHERWDGTGYPLGLKGEEIPLLARAMAIVDVYNALISKRAYKEAFSYEEALKIIEDGQGTQFDPGLVSLFLSISDTLHKIGQKATM